MKVWTPIRLIHHFSQDRPKYSRPSWLKKSTILILQLKPHPKQTSTIIMITPKDFICPVWIYPMSMKHSRSGSNHFSIGSICITVAQFESLYKPKHKCPFCDYETRNKKNIKLHVRRKHTGEKPFSCDFPQCDYKAVSKRCIKNHSVVHSNTRHVIYVSTVRDRHRYIILIGYEIHPGIAGWHVEDVL